jgi:hypothetical protein
LQNLGCILRVSPFNIFTRHADDMVDIALAIRLANTCEDILVVPVAEIPAVRRRMSMSEADRM